MLENRTSVQLTGGTQGTFGLSAVSDFVSDDGEFAAQVAAFTLRSDGFYGLRPSKRGAVDRRLDLKTRGAELRAVWRPAADVTIEPSRSIALGYPVTREMSLRASAGTAFRLPTINELYRPFRVRDDITEANAGLDPARFFSVDTGIEWRPSDAFSCDVGFFHHWIHDAIANVPITDPAEAMAIAGFVPPGGSVAQRRNVEEARVWGIESQARWQVAPRCALTLRYLFSQSEFTESSDQPLLEGKRFPQAPRHRLVAGVEGDLMDCLSVFAQVDFGSSQFDDALERRRLDSWSSTRIGGELAVSDDLTLHGRLENLFDEEIPTGLSSSGLESIGMPRSFWMNVTGRF